MKHYLSPLLKSLGITVGLDGALLLFIYAATPLTEIAIGQALLFGGVTLLLLTAVCLYAAVPAERRRSLWLSLAVSVPVHLILSVVSVLVYGNRLSAYWPGSSDLAWLLFLLITVAAWVVTTFTLTMIRSARIGSALREGKRQIRRAEQGSRLETAPISPARSLLLAILKGVLWVLWLHVLTGLLLELLWQAGVADTMLSYVAFPCLWCLMAAAYGCMHVQNRFSFTLSVAVSHLICFLGIMLFLIPANITEHPYYALKYLDDMITDPFGHPEELMILVLFFAVWIILAVFSIANRKRKE